MRQRNPMIDKGIELIASGAEKLIVNSAKGLVVATALFVGSGEPMHQNNAQAQVAVDGSRMTFEREYADRNSQWRENVIRDSKGEPLIDYAPVDLVHPYLNETFVAVLGGEYDLLPEEEKMRTLRIWSSTVADPNRKSICRVYQNTYRYYRDRLNAEQKNQFNDLNAAYDYSIRHFANPANIIFWTTNGSATTHYKTFNPWIYSLNKPTIADRMMIYRTETLDNPGVPSRINWENVRKYSALAFQERDAELARRARENK